MNHSHNPYESPQHGQEDVILAELVDEKPALGPGTIPSQFMLDYGIQLICIGIATAISLAYLFL